MAAENARSKEPEKLIGRNVEEFMTCPVQLKEFHVRVKDALHKNLSSVHLEYVLKYDGKRERRKCSITKSADEPSTALVNFYTFENLN